MAINTISYDTKSDIETSSVPNNNKVSAGDLNEIKQVVNQNANLVGDGDNLIGASNIIDYLMNNTVKKLLWENPNPNDVMSTLQIDLIDSDYDMYEVIYYNWRQQKYYSSAKAVKGQNIALYSMISYTNKVYMGIRTITYVSDTKLNIGNNITLIDNSVITSGQPNTEWTIPVFIIGYKTGLFS